MFKIKSCLLQLICCLVLVQGFSQSKESNLKGIIIDPSGTPVIGATVQIIELKKGVVSDNDGRFGITANLNGTYTLEVSFLGYESKRQSVAIKQGESKTISFKLEESNYELNEVQVKGVSKVQRVREQAFNTTAIDLKKIYNTSADLNQVLNKTTGVRVRESGGMGSNFNFSLNGFSGNQVKFFMDGIPIDHYGSSFTLNNIPVNMAERIDVYKGVVPIELGGDALGGAVNIVTNKNVNRYIDASYSLGSFNTHKASVSTRFTNKNGLVAGVNAFVNYSDNSYKVDVSVADPFTGVYGPVQKYKHFHDGYKQGTLMAEVGVKNKSYADYLLVGLTGSTNKKEIQQGSTMLAVVGDAFEESKNLVPSLKYKKTGLFTKKLTADVAASYNIAQERKIDTSSARYNWTGGYEIKNYESGGEVNPYEKTIMVFDVNSLQTNVNFKYDLNENNFLALNHTYVSYERKEDNEYDENHISSKPYLRKNILGASYNLFALEKRLSFTAFAKMYDLQTKVQNADDVTTESSFNDYGYGTAVAYFIIPEEFQVKASYEHAYRLQSATELLGDGLLVLPNPDLDPENSDNYNLGVLYKKSYIKNYFGLQGNFIYREAKDFIQGRAQGINSISVNSKNVRVTGVDGVVQYGYGDWLTFEVNATYQKTVDMNPVGQYGTNQVNYLYKKQLPNTPILYGNAELGFNFSHLKYADDSFMVNFSGSFSDSYYLNYPSLGAPEYKKEIPKQLFYSTGLAYSLKNGRYNIALECRNITDVKLYDFFNVQKPGRSFTLKLRYFLM